MSALESARDRLIFALDVGDRDEGLRIADSLAGELRWIKVATTLFTSAGAEFIEELRERGFDIFLDLKFHDIPAQVEGACRSAAERLQVQRAWAPQHLECWPSQCSRRWTKATSERWGSTAVSTTMCSALRSSPKRLDATVSSPLQRSSPCSDPRWQPPLAS